MIGRRKFCHYIVEYDLMLLLYTVHFSSDTEPLRKPTLVHTPLPSLFIPIMSSNAPSCPTSSMEPPLIISFSSKLPAFKSKFLVLTHLEINHTFPHDICPITVTLSFCSCIFISLGFSYSFPSISYCGWGLPFLPTTPYAGFENARPCCKYM